MTMRRIFALLFTALLPFFAMGQAADLYNPAEIASTTFYPPVPLQPKPSQIAATLLDTRSNIITHPGGGAGGADASRLQTTSLGMGTLGFGHQFSLGNRVADNFTVPAAGWVVDKITTYAYQTGSTTTSTMTGLRFQIWNGPPNVVGSAVVFGDLTTNRMTATLFTNIYRETETTTGATSRPIMAVEAGGLNIVLPGGTYWLDWFVDGSLASGPWAVPLTVLGQPITGDGLQFIADIVTPPGTWNNALDGGTNTPAQGFPMTISGFANGSATLTQSDGTTNVTEGGSTDSFTLVLNSAPTADVTITLTPGSQVSVAPSTLTFTPANWNVAQTVTVTAVNDAVVEGAHSGIISFAVASTDPGYTTVSIPNLSVNVTDNDVAGVTVTPTTINAAEGGAPGNFSVVLTSQPTADVTVALSSDAQSSLSTMSLTFTAANWNVAQVVTVTAVDDSTIEGNHVSTVTTGAAVSSDANYNGLTVADVTVNIADNDVAGLTVAVGGGGALALSESGVAGTLSVVLNTQPTANVTVTLSGGGQLGVSPIVFVFTAANWNVPQFTTVSAIDDNIVEGPHNGTVSFTVTSTDGNYNGLVIASVPATIVDNDFAVIAEPIPVPTWGPLAPWAALLLMLAAAGFGQRRWSSRR